MNKLLLSLSLVFFTILLTACYYSTRPHIGNAAPDFTIQDQDHKVTLSQFRGQVVVVNFWATWCPPCVAETYSLIRMQQRFQDKGVVVLAVSIDDDQDAYHRFLKKYGVNFVTVRDPSARVEHLYGTVQIPESYIIDSKGVLRRKVVNALDWESPEITQFLNHLSESKL